LATPDEACLGGREVAERGDLVIEVVGEGVHESAEVIGQSGGVGVAGRGVRLPGEREKAVVAE
jgi:hypothetical protein